MADYYPGAWRVEMGGNGNAITKRPANNIFHIAASSWNIVEDDPHTAELEQLSKTRGIAGWNDSANACNGYVDQYGNMQQYCSVFAAVNGTYQGNPRNRTWESWNPEGLNGTNAQYNSSVWTEAQLWRFADLLAWDHIENGALLQDMKNSLASSQGCGVHRYGIPGYDPYDSVGGEKWTTVPGKPCPGTARVRQLGTIVDRSKMRVSVIRAGKDTYLPAGRVDIKRVAAVSGGAAVLGQTGGGWWQDWFGAA